MKGFLYFVRMRVALTDNVSLGGGNSLYRQRKNAGKYMCASSEVFIQSDHGWLRRPSAKGRDGGCERNLGFRERSIATHSSLLAFKLNAFPFLQCAGMLPGMLKGERVASLSEAQAQSQSSYPKIRERSAKRHVSRASTQHCKRWETTKLLQFGFGIKGLGKF